MAAGNVQFFWPRNSRFSLLIVTIRKLFDASRAFETKPPYQRELLVTRGFFIHIKVISPKSTVASGAYETYAI
ncbi:hypothetical protein OUZ56_027622 [Daphnia magna]|uniref:Uncharacterized protein n=1 Tax=Daphnia magna TaxID=35525 RepID=A0ABR0B1G0_9CRUS|nr:hypothetical protein OUZ56_027622 [Daphnia magna]